MNDISSSALAEIRAELMSIVAKADGTVKDVENSTAEAILEFSGKFNEVFAKELYHWSVKTETDAAEQTDLYDRLQALPKNEKIKLVRALWAVAASDSEIHPSEHKIIDEAMKAMGVDHSMLDTDT